MQGYGSYQQQSLTLASSEDILIRLLQGAIFRLKQAQDLWGQGEEAKARELRGQAYAIVAELDASLDREGEATEVIESLESLYGFMHGEFGTSIRMDDFARLSTIQEILEVLLVGFQEAVQEVKKQKNQMHAERQNLHYAV